MRESETLKRMRGTLNRVQYIVCLVAVVATKHNYDLCVCEMCGDSVAVQCLYRARDRERKVKDRNRQ